MFYDHENHGRNLRHILRAIGRHRGTRRHGHGHGGRGERGFFGNGGDIPRGRKLSSADLQLAILALLEQAPAHGYELIRLFAERSDGFYSPSPGMVYPALTYLEEINHISQVSEGPRKQYSLTEAGTSHLCANRAAADAILASLARIGSRMEEVREAYAGIADLDPASADILHDARHALKRALMSRRGCNAADAQKIAQILLRATQEINKI